LSAALNLFSFDPIPSLPYSAHWTCIWAVSKRLKREKRAAGEPIAGESNTKFSSEAYLASIVGISALMRLFSSDCLFIPQCSKMVELVSLKPKNQENQW